MATPQLSPGVLTREVDLTVGRAENVLDNIGAIAGPFELGPVNEPTTVSTEQELINVFGQPRSSDQHYEYWMSASSFLSYGGVMKVVRVDGEALTNSNVGQFLGNRDIKIKNYDDYQANHSGEGAGWYYAAKNPGEWGNRLKVCYIDNFGDQVLGIGTTSATNLGAQVGFAVTVDITGTVIPGVGRTEPFEGFLKGIITDVIDGGDTTNSAVIVKIESRVSSGGTQPGRETKVEYAENSNYASFLKGQRLTFQDTNSLVTSPKDSISAVGITTSTAINGQQGQVYIGVAGTSSANGGSATFTITRNNTDGNVASATIVNAGLGYTVGETVSIGGSFVGGFDLAQGSIKTNTGLSTSTTIPAASNGIYLNVAGVSTVGAGATFNVYRDGTGGIGTVTMINSGLGYAPGTVITLPGNLLGGATPTDDAQLAVQDLLDDKVILTITESNSRVQVTGVDDWYNSRTLGLDNSVIYWRTIAPKPGTSAYAAERNGFNDEMHVVVVDDNGSITGVRGNVLEKHLFLSKATDAVSAVNSPQKTYFKQYLANFSKYIYAGTNQSVASDVFHGSSPTSILHQPKADQKWTSVGGDTETSFAVADPVNNQQWGRTAAGNNFSAVGQLTYSLEGGQDYGGSLVESSMATKLGDIIAGYELFNNKEDVAVDYLIMGPGLTTINDSQAKANKLISIADGRKDCVALIGPHRFGIVDITNPVTQTQNLLEYFGPLSSSSYAIFDSGYKYTYDRFNNQFRYIPCNADIAGLMCRTNLVAYPWFSPAGQQRGVLKNAIKLAYNPNKTQRDSLYSARINSVVNQSGAGVLLFGDKTALAYASAFDRINVRRLFLTVEQALQRAAEAQLFEFNDQITRTNFVNIVEPYLRDIQAKRGVYDYLVICDETNNTPDVIDNNEFRADIFLKPAKSINYVTLTFVATRTGVSFEEVAGRV